MFPLPSSNARRPATPFLLPTNKGALLKAHLQRGCSEGHELFASTIPPSLHRRLCGDKSILPTRADQVPSLPERCKIVASFFGDLKGAFAALGARAWSHINTVTVRNAVLGIGRCRFEKVSARWHHRLLQCSHPNWQRGRATTADPRRHKKVGRFLISAPPSPLASLTCNIFYTKKRGHSTKHP